MKLVSPDFGKATTVAAHFQHEVGVPLQAMIEISDRCNEVCVHCYQEQGQKGEMDTQQVCALLDQLAEQGVMFLSISGGEPTLRKDFVEILHHAHQLGFVMRVFTNGLTMTPELARAFYDNAVEAAEISVYAPDAETHDFVTGVPGSFVRTTRAIELLVTAGVMVVMKTPVMSLNEHKLDAYVALARSLGAQYALAPRALHPREGGSLETQAFDRSEQVFAKLVGENNRDVRAPGKRRRGTGTKSCGAGDSIHIEPNGELRPCTLLELDMGNVADAPLAEVRAKSHALAGLKSLDWSMLHGCRECDIAGYCGRCYAHALAEAGDALGPYASGCRAAMTQYELKNARTITHAPVLGPFAVQDDGSCKPMPDTVTEADLALAAELGWTRRKGGAAPAPSLPARPGELIQLRRPGRKKAIEQRVPLGVKASG